MMRRDFVASVLTGSVAAPTLLAQHDHDQLSGPQASETVSFGSWMTDPPLNRFNAPTPNSANKHAQLPFEAQIKSGGSVNFVISGFHILGIYGPGTAFDDVSGAVTIPIPLAPPGFPQAVNDPVNRVYWGVNPFSLAPPPVLDRVEAVTFGAPGTYLVICTFVPHFNGRMHGFMKVLP